MMRFQNLFMKEVISMDNVLRQILRENQFFEEMNENRFVPEYLGLIVGYVKNFVGFNTLKTS